MPTICPKCNYARRDADNCPLWQCPSCQVAYAKVGESLNVASSVDSARKGFHPTPEPSIGAWKWALAAVIVIGVVWQTKHSAPRQPATPAASEQVTAMAGQPEISIYTTSWCGYCKAARTFFNENRIRYVEYDAETSADAAQTVQKHTGGGVPLIFIGDDIMKGFDEGELRRRLKSWLRPI